ncbi:S8 family serine peptidase [Flavicella sp.]|nr:S8 family serine peptidase [Flavicella sp.]MDA9111455.1 S8 family serine peptidase [Flavicella sp.]
MIKKTLFLFSFFVCAFAHAQQEEAWIYLSEKTNVDTYFSNPLTMLSQRALDRRVRQGIALDDRDVPLDAGTVSAISNTVGVTVMAKSKWLNALHVRGTKTAIDPLSNFSGVASITYGDNKHNKSKITLIEKRQKLENIKDAVLLDYGSAANQIEMLHGDVLHAQGFQGVGLQIAILDAGFKGVETFAAFSKLHDNNLDNGEILGGYDYVNRSPDFYQETGSEHGLSVLSTIAADIEGLFLGTAPKAQFYLFVTEDPPNETPLEESLWVEAAEKSDSLGVDIINTSLGYTTFDESRYNYTYSDMDGETTFVSRGAEVAVAKGIFVVVSAGNSGNSSWKYIGAPADAPSVLSVGAVDAQEESAYFSSYGPSADGRIKPDVLAQGLYAYVINSSGNISPSNGTSFSAPIITGLVACLWQSCPSLTVAELRQVIKESADLYAMPTAHRGYGIPNFEAAYKTLIIEKINKAEWELSSNFGKEFLNLKLSDEVRQISARVLAISGKVMQQTTVFKENPSLTIFDLSLGLYLLELKLDGRKKVFKFVKTN